MVGCSDLTAKQSAVTRDKKGKKHPDPNRHFSAGQEWWHHIKGFE
jgi:hypothetical protein